jgi:(p)ppGpp synthase/HD superfamily hydrolase
MPQANTESPETTTTQVEHARANALAAHGDQRYGQHPYSVHLDDVVEILRQHTSDEATLIAGYLHDVVEDTPTPIEAIAHQYGELVAQCVTLLTDASGANRKARKAATYARLAAIAGDAPEARALVVKTADRLANVRRSRMDKNHHMMDLYRGEYKAFREATFREGICDPLWAELDKLLSS